MLIRALVGPGSQSGCNLHAGCKLFAARLAGRRFVITSGCLTRRASPQRDRSDRALEYNPSTCEGYGIAGLNAARRLHTLPIDVHLAAAHRICGRRTRLEQSDSEEPAVDASRARSGFGGSFAHVHEYN